MVVVLVEPAHDLVGAHQVDGAERLPKRRLEEHGRSLVIFETFYTFSEIFFYVCPHQRSPPLVEQHQQSLKHIRDVILDVPLGPKKSGDLIIPGHKR